MDPLVSVVTITRNSASHVSKAIESVLTQRYHPVEYIIVDGASTDGTLDVARRYQKGIHLIASEPDDGIYDAMNKGLRLASGRHVIFVNSDDSFAHPDALASLVSARRRGPEAPTICYSDFIKHYPTLGRSMRVAADAALDRGFMLCHQAMLVDRSAYDLVGYFDTSFRFAADHDWTARAERAGVHFLRAHVAPTIVFTHGGASHVNYRTSRSEAGKVILREYGSVAFVRYSARQYWLYLLRSLADLLEHLIGHRSVAALQRFYFLAVRRYRRHDEPYAG